MSFSDQLNMSSLPPVFILPTHLQTEDLHEAEDALYNAGGRLSYRAPEARIFLGKIVHKKRAAFDLRARGVWTVEEPVPSSILTSKRPKLDRNSTQKVVSGSETESPNDTPVTGSKRKRSLETDTKAPDLANHIVVLKLNWLDDCNKQNAILPFDQYLVYSGKVIPKPVAEKKASIVNDNITYIKAIPESQSSSPESSRTPGHKANPGSILERAKAEAASLASSSQAVPFHRRKFGQKSTSPTFSHSPPRPHLYRATTSELEHGGISKLPPVPAWMEEKHPRPMYSCLRNTPPLDTNPNRHFIGQLSMIKEARLLTLDEIGVRAYSTSIASLSAYSHRITSPLEIIRLPGCNDKIATLWVEWYESITQSDPSHTPPTTLADKNDNENDTANSSRDAALDPYRTIPSVLALSTDPDLIHIRTFHNIWGVGAETARKFYYNNGWTSLDDAIEFGWTTLTRVQQIGLKFHDEFLLTIPRLEVESIARTILHHARTCRSIPSSHWTNDVTPGHNGATTSNPGSPLDFVCAIVGGYRRGKPASGDVDVILSHRDARMTQDLVVDVVSSLEKAGFITHTLTLHTTTSDRDQQTLPYRADGGGHGFDSLDKALCVWQDPEFDDAEAKEGKNPNVHRRVDIIVSAWRTVGCAVLGWSGGTTFQRDIRRWVKRERGWKFDSSGVRDRGSGRIVELEEGEGDVVEGWEDRERRLMEGLGIGWRDARERCTG